MKMEDRRGGSTSAHQVALPEGIPRLKNRSGFAATCRADHQDVFGRYLIAQFGTKPLAAPAIAKRDRNRALGIFLADNMLIKGGNDGLGCEVVCHSSFREAQTVSTVRLPFVKTQISAATAIALRAICSGSSS